MKKSDSILQIYDQNVAWYDSERGRSLQEKKYLDRIVAGIPPGGKLLDIGCGTGRPIAEYFISQGLQVTGVDGAKNMIEKAQSFLPNAKWLVADMRTLKLDEKFDAVVAWDSFFHLTPEDQRKMFDVFEEHLKPQGLLMFTSGPDAGEVFGNLNGNELYHSSLATAEYREILGRKSFQVIEHQVEDPDCGGHTVWIAQKN